MLIMNHLKWQDQNTDMTIISISMLFLPNGFVPKLVPNHFQPISKLKSSKTLFSAAFFEKYFFVSSEQSGAKSPCRLVPSRGSN